MLLPEATTAAARWSPRGWSSARAAVAVPVAKPAAVPLTTRAAMSSPMPEAARNSAVLTACRRAGAAPAPQRRSDVAGGGRRHQRDADPPDDRLGEIGHDRGALDEVPGPQQRRQFGEGGGHRQAERASHPSGEAIQRLTAVRPP